jgi:ADP-ribose pyrophosphatase YjhB (NUDIX family)
MDGHRFEGPLEAVMREVEEETGISLSDLVLVGSSYSDSSELNVSSLFYYFHIRAGATISIGKQDAYVASSFTLPSNIKNFMTAVENTDAKFGRFDSLRRVGDADVVLDALSTIQRPLTESELRVWKAKTQGDSGRYAKQGGSAQAGSAASSYVVKSSTATAARPHKTSDSWVPNVSTGAARQPPVLLPAAQEKGQEVESSTASLSVESKVGPATLTAPSPVVEASKPAAKKKKDSETFVIDDGAGDEPFDDSFLQSFAKMGPGSGGRGSHGGGGGRGGGSSSRR